VTLKGFIKQQEQRSDAVIGVPGFMSSSRIERFASREVRNSKPPVEFMFKATLHLSSACLNLQRFKQIIHRSHELNIPGIYKRVRACVPVSVPEGLILFIQLELNASLHEVVSVHCRMKVSTKPAVDCNVSGSHTLWVFFYE
jgi:hypothetical protein